eukprot:1159541-Pelagomonas_calceolata.AAC.2
MCASGCTCAHKVIPVNCPPNQSHLVFMPPACTLECPGHNKHVPSNKMCWRAVACGGALESCGMWRRSGELRHVEAPCMA